MGNPPAPLTGTDSIQYRFFVRMTNHATQEICEQYGNWKSAATAKLSWVTKARRWHKKKASDECTVEVFDRSLSEDVPVLVQKC